MAIKNIIKGIEGAGKAVGGGIKKILKSGSFEPNYIENKLMPKQASDFVKKQKTKVFNSIPKKVIPNTPIKKVLPKKKVAPTYNQVQKSVQKTMGKK